MPALDLPEGGRALGDLLDAVQVEYPDHHPVVIIDTTGRAVQGDENSADTIRSFYRWTGLGLKQRGATWARLDHAGQKTSDEANRVMTKMNEFDHRLTGLEAKA